MDDSELRSGGKRIGLALWPTEPVAQLARHAALAEQVGIDSIWVIDSQLLCREVTVTLAACLAATTRLRVATGVTQPSTRHPSVLASAMATLAELSGGRAILGVGTGFSSLRTIGLRQARIAEVETMVATIRTLLDGGRVSFNGTEAQLSWVTAPVRVPIVLAATGPRMTRAAARIGDGVILHQGLSDDLLDRALGWLRDGAAEAGRDPDGIEVSVWAPYCLAADPQEARDRVRSRVAGALATAQPGWFTGAEREAVEQLQARYDVSHHATANTDHAALVPDSLVDRYALAGTAPQIKDRLAALLARRGVHRVILNPQVMGAGARPLPEVLQEFHDQVLAA